MATAEADNMATNDNQGYSPNGATVSKKRDASEISNGMLNDVRNQQQQQPQEQQRMSYNEREGAAQAFESMASGIQNSIGVPNRNSRSRRLPCKARGMGDSHTSATAYFDIPAGLQHGAVLACSHPACAGSGRRFRYCQVCEVPVAKRNFQKRHSHGLVPVGDPMLMANAGHNRVHDDNDQETEGKHRRSVSYDAADTLNQLGAAKTDGGRASMTGGGSNSSPSGEKPMCINLTSQEFRWLALLHNRPSVHDHSGMEKWMTSIIDTSEKTGTALGRETVTPPTPPQEPAAASTQPNAQASQAPAAPAPSQEPVRTISSLPEARPPASGFGLFMSLASKQRENQTNSSDTRNSMFPPPPALKPAQAEMKKPSASPPEDETGYETEQHSNGGSGSGEQRKYSSSPGRPSGENSASHPESASPKEEEEKPPQTLADYMSRKKKVAERAARLLNSDSKNTENAATEQDDHSQNSSVVTKPAIRRRRSVQDARQLMGLIKLSGMKENDFDEIF